MYLHGVVPATKSVKTRAWHCNPDDIVHESRDAMEYNSIIKNYNQQNQFQNQIK